LKVGGPLWRLSIALVIIGEVPTSDVLDEVTDCVTHNLPDVGVAAQEARGEVLRDAEHVMQNKDLAITMGPGPDANRRDD
jgi:hypothetical protein